MAFETLRRSVGTTPSLLYAHPKSEDVAGDHGSKRVELVRLDPIPSQVVYIGGSTVTTATGVRWPAIQSTWVLEVEAGEAVYAVVASGVEPIDVLVSGR